VDLRDRRELNRGFGDGLSRAFELTLTPMVVALIGLGIDRWLGTLPIFTIVFAFWGLGVTTYTAWLRYDNDMRRYEGERAEAQAAASTAPVRRGRARSIATRPAGTGALDG
jgi:F0F1-type ATP synthase assembly protein I